MFQDALSASARQEIMVTEPKQGKQHRNLEMPCKPKYLNTFILRNGTSPSR